MTTAFEQIASHVLAGTNDMHVVIGPLLWQPSDGTEAKRWYFIIATSEAGRGFRCDKIEVKTDEREQMRASVIFALVRRRPIVIHDMGDEVSMARLCETLWPGPRIAQIRQQIEADYAARQRPGNPHHRQECE
jgi:hypothetical protein